MDIIQESFQRLFPDKECSYTYELEYNRRLSSFNANIRRQGNTIQVNLNLQWKDIDQEIKIGLIQHLLLKILKAKGHTQNIDLYHHFVKNIPLMTPKVRGDEMLEASFQRVNGQFFSTMMEQPNLCWGTDSRRKLAHYNFHDDTITVSTIFQQAKIELLDAVMYHELLHKQHQFSHRNGRSSFHSPAFREDERRFPNHDAVEKEIQQLARKKRWGLW